MTEHILFQGITPKEFLSQIDLLIASRIDEKFNQQKEISFSDREYITGPEVDDFFSITAPTRYAWEKKGLFNRYKVGGRTRYKSSEVMAAFKRIENLKNV